MSSKLYDQKTIHVVCFLDGRPGHEKQTLGIIRALKKKVPVKVTDVRVARNSFWKTLWGIVGLGFPGSRLREPEIIHPDLLIGTGSQTHLQILLYKKKYNIPAVTCMAPDLIFRSRFDLCFVPVHDGLQQKGNIINTIGPPNCSVNKKRHKRDRGLILLGGIDNKSHHWNSTEIIKKIEQIIVRDSRCQWRISSSPRTPESMILGLEKITILKPNVTFFNYRDTEPGWVERQYDSSDIVWVTADSVSMIFEALTAGCKVGVIPVEWRKQTNKFQKSVLLLEQRNLVLPYETWIRQGGDWSEYENLNEAQRCADILLTRWWPKILQ